MYNVKKVNEDSSFYSNILYPLPGDTTCREKIPEKGYISPAQNKKSRLRSADGSGFQNSVVTKGNKRAVRIPATVRERLPTAPCS